MAARIKICARTCASCEPCFSMTQWVLRNTPKLRRMSPSVMTGQRRADMFSCPIGTSMVGLLLRDRNPPQTSSPRCGIQGPRSFTVPSGSIVTSNRFIPLGSSIRPILTVPSGSEVSLKRFCPSGISTRPTFTVPSGSVLKSNFFVPSFGTCHPKGQQKRYGAMTTCFINILHSEFHHGRGGLPNYQRHGCLTLERKRIAAADQDQCDREEVRRGARPMCWTYKVDKHMRPSFCGYYRL